MKLFEDGTKAFFNKRQEQNGVVVLVQPIDIMTEPSSCRIELSVGMKACCTILRRLWFIDPFLSRESAGRVEAETDESSFLEAFYLSACTEFDEAYVKKLTAWNNGQYISNTSWSAVLDKVGARDDALWDDASWMMSTRYSLVDPVLTYRSPEDRSHVTSPWRELLYNLYRPLLSDFCQRVKGHPETENFEKFEPYNANACRLYQVFMESKRGTWDYDTIIYPIWFNPQASVTLRIGENRYYWDKAANCAWGFWLWIPKAKEVIIDVEIPGDVCAGEYAAIFILGHCGKVTQEQAVNVKNSAVSAPVVDHVARAIFSRAGDAVKYCDFNRNYLFFVKNRELNDELAHLDNQGTGGPHPYGPLPPGNYIRILVLEPESSGVNLRTLLRVVNLDDSPAYEAMSHTWDDTQNSTMLRVRDHTVSIPKNLEDALVRIRHPYRRRYLWVDAVSINQDDIAERGQQASMMRSIYSKATRVLVWLGKDESNQAEAAFGNVCNIVRCWRPQKDDSRFSIYNHNFHPTSARENWTTMTEEKGRRALQVMFETENFTRINVSQELVLGETAIFIWGGFQISWRLIGICAAWIISRGWPFLSEEALTAAYNAFAIYALPLAKKTDLSSFPRLELPWVLTATKEICGSIDARDELYAVLGLPSTKNNSDGKFLIPLDHYDKTMRHIYLEATRKMLVIEGHLRLLSAVQHGLEINDTSYPSWLPRYDGAFLAEPLALREEHGYYANAGELFVPCKDSFGLDGESLILSGLKCAVVSEVTRVFTKGNVSSDLPKKDSDAMTTIRAYLNDRGDIRASWFTIFGCDDPEMQEKLFPEVAMASAVGLPGKYRHGHHGSRGSPIRERALIDDVVEFFLLWRDRRAWDVDALKHKNFAPFWEEVQKSKDPNAMERALCSIKTFIGRRIFHCEDGRLGLGPAAMRPNDVVTILFGSIVPYVLRPLDDAGQRWTLVGECLVPTLMQGEAVEAAGLPGKGGLQECDGSALPPDEDPKFHREVGKNGIVRFEIR